MTIGLIANIGNSLQFAFDKTVKKFLRWIGMSIVFCIPIVQLITQGIFMKVYRGEEPDFSNAGKSFIQGLLYWIAGIVYALIPLIVLGLSAMFSFSESLAIISLIGLLIGLILTVIVGFIMIPMQVNLARKQSFGAAFAFKEIFGMIGKLGLIKYILAWIVYFITVMIIVLVLSLFSLIPVAGMIIVSIIAFLFGPFIGLFTTKYFSNLFE